MLNQNTDILCDDIRYSNWTPNRNTNNPYEIIEDWNLKCEEERYRMLVSGVLNATSYYGTKVALRMFELSEIVNETWLTLQKT